MEIFAFKFELILVFRISIQFESLSPLEYSKYSDDGIFDNLAKTIVGDTNYEKQIIFGNSKRNKHQSENILTVIILKLLIIRENLLC